LIFPLTFPPTPRLWKAGILSPRGEGKRNRGREIALTPSFSKGRKEKSSGRFELF
jgi:hypothetical protein